MAVMSPQFKAVFHHYPRTGGSSIRQALATTASFPSAHASTKTYHEATVEHGARWAYFVKICSDQWFHFGMVRNPYDFVVSLCRNWDRLEFKEFVKHAFHLKQIKPVDMAGYEFISQCEHFQVGKYAANPEYPDKGYRHLSLYRFEEEGHRRLLETTLGMASGEIKHIGASKRSADWRTYYDKESADIVTRTFEADLEHFGYDRFIP